MNMRTAPLNNREKQAMKEIALWWHEACLANGEPAPSDAFRAILDASHAYMVACSGFRTGMPAPRKDAPANG